MTKTLHALAIGFGLLAWMTPAFAQDTTTPAPVPAPAPDAAAPTDLAMGTPAKPGLPTQADATVGATYLAANFDKWEQRCVKTEDGSDPCQLYQLLLDKDNNPVAEISMFNLKDGGKAAAGATFVAPLETLLTANVKVAVDGGEGKLYPFSFCTRNGCVARIGLTADEVTQFKKGVKAVITIIPAAAPDKTVDLDLTLKGFTAGYEAVKATNK
jgi:invasion protein IalB